MAGFSITLEGMDVVQESLRRVPDETRAALTDIIAKTAFASQQRMIAGAPRGLTGRLKASITARSRGLSGFVEIRDAYYWRFVESGTVRMPARPFVRPAREAESLAFAQRIKVFATRMERDFAAGRLA